MSGGWKDDAYSWPRKGLPKVLSQILSNHCLSSQLGNSDPLSTFCRGLPCVDSMSFVPFWLVPRIYPSPPCATSFGYVACGGRCSSLLSFTFLSLPLKRPCSLSRPGTTILNPSDRKDKGPSVPRDGTRTAENAITHQSDLSYLIADLASRIIQTSTATQAKQTKLIYS